MIEIHIIKTKKSIFLFINRHLIILGILLLQKIIPIIMSVLIESIPMFPHKWTRLSHQEANMMHRKHNQQILFPIPLIIKPNLKYSQANNSLILIITVKNNRIKIVRVSLGIEHYTKTIKLDKMKFMQRLIQLWKLLALTQVVISVT